jgi:hypothetical protein
MSQKKDQHTTHMFHAPELSFMMTASKRMSDGMKTLCTVTGNDRWILMRSCEEKVRMAVDHIGGKNQLNELFP